VSDLENNTAGTYYFVFKTGMGWCGVVSSENGVLRIVIGCHSREDILREIMGAFGRSITKIPPKGDIVDEIKRYFSGERVSFNCAIDWSSLSLFQQKVFKAARKIPYGRFESYGSLAKKAGCPNGSRAVGGALARNPLPLVIPCHRIVRGDGGLGGFSAVGGVTLKRTLLRLEGINQPFEKECNKKVRKGSCRSQRI
jgi:methylated-DNA-[protein]-cysteine S-methyltransferase